LTVLLGAGLLFGASGNVIAKTRCHVHPPADADAPSAPVPATIGPYEDRDACEQARHALFGQLGRCHCTADFTPGWVGGEPGGGPMPPGLPPGAAMP
jgi:hypothetical protein